MLMRLKSKDAMKDYEDRTMSYQEILAMRRQMIQETEEFLNQELIPAREASGINTPQQAVSSAPDTLAESTILEPNPMYRYAYRRN